MSAQSERMALDQAIPQPLPDLGAGVAGKAVEPHPGGPIKHGFFIQGLRILAFAIWLNAVIWSIHVAQNLYLCAYYINRKIYYKLVASTKESFGIFIITIIAWFTPTKIRVSGDASVRDQFHLTKDGCLQTKFPQRLIMMANHQIYTDWLYLWWVAYTSNTHGYIYIILKESLKYIPLAGPGMVIYGFIFLARNWIKDKSRLQQQLRFLNGPCLTCSSPSPNPLPPMWLLLFPEGTNLSDNTHNQSGKWAAKQGIKNVAHQILPRSTGLRFCLQELHETVEWLYDCTVAYEGIP